MTEAEKTDLQEIKSDIKTLHKKLFEGNGQPALVTRLTIVENNQANCPARAALSNSSRSLKLQTATIVVAIVSLLVSILVYVS